MQNCHARTEFSGLDVDRRRERDGVEVKLLSVPDILHQQMSLFMGIMVSSGNAPAAYPNTHPHMHAHTRLQLSR